MNERPRRPILHLKLGTPTPSLEPKPKPAPLPVPAATPFRAPARPAFARRKPVAPTPPGWKCRPCGAAFDPPPSLADDDHVRCPSCNARLGLARDFRSDPPAVDRLRARPAKR
jgi:hypothetical protein